MKALKTILLLFVVSRLIMFGFLSIGQPDQTHYVDNQLQLDNPLLDHFVLYDSYNYAQIATEGYAENRLTAFFPLYPLIVRGVTIVTGIDVYWTGFLLSNFFFMGSLWLLYTLMEKRGLGERVRVLTLSALVFFPSSYFFSAFYTESFFLFLALLAFRFWGNEKRGAAYFIGGLAALSRIVGVWVPLAFFVERLIRRKLDIIDCVFALMSSLIFFSYPVYLWLTKDEPLLFLKVMAPAYSRYSTFPFYPIYQDLVTLIERTGRIEPIILLHLLLFAVFISYLIATVRLQRKGVTLVWSEVLYTFGLILMPLSSILIQPIHIASHGFMRYFLTIFPLFIFIGKHLDQLLKRANRNSGHSSFIVWKSVGYTTLLIWVTFTLYILLALRFKGFVA
jgi:Gpi18-like mannosyltransferase